MPGYRYRNHSSSTTFTMDGALQHPQQLLKDSQSFVSKCTKPSRAEFVQILRAVGAGFLMMGAIGYVVKLVHIPIRHLITV